VRESIWAAMVAGLLLLSNPAFAQLEIIKRHFAEDADLVKSLQQGGYILYWRHTKTNHEQLDQKDVDFKDCLTQRNLSSTGREQASAIGTAIKALHIKIGKTYTSPFCRCRDTAGIAFGDYEVVKGLRFSITAGSNETRDLVQVLRKMLVDKPASGGNTVIVSHAANLKETTGLWPKPEGAMEVFRPLDDGRVEYYGKLQEQDWQRLVELNL